MTVDTKQFHNRLDLKLTSEQYTAPNCGSLNLETGEPEYCNFNCPVLKGTEQQKVDPAQADTTDAAV